MVLTTVQAATLLGVSRAAIATLIRGGKLHDVNAHKTTRHDFGIEEIEVRNFVKLRDEEARLRRTHVLEGQIIPERRRLEAKLDELLEMVKRLL